MLVGFDPITSKEPYVLILGSMPSITSLEKQEYYGFAHNRFWKFMANIFAMPTDTYEQKKAIIRKRHLALWDVIHSCEREGSLDSAIRKERVNDIAGFIQKHTTIRLVICNGKNSYELYQKHFQNLGVSCVYLGSTSNANRSIKENILYEQWKQTLWEALGYGNKTM